MTSESKTGARAPASRQNGTAPGLGLASIRDANGPRAIDTLLRDRGSGHAELFRALGALKALQVEAAAGAGGDANLLPPSATPRIAAPR